MKKFIKRIFALIAFWIIPAAASAGTAIERASEIVNDAGAGIFTEGEEAVALENVIGNYINTVVGILGVIAVILIVYAGALWLTAAGNDTKVDKAKKILTSTIIGVLIVGLAYAITAFVIGAITR